MLKLLAGRFLSRVYHPLRHIFDIFDKVDLTAAERENTGNVERFKALVKEIVAERRLEGKESHTASFDFLSQLLSDDMYKDNEKMIMDECLTFIGAATQTTTILLTNIVYYLTKNPDVKAKLMKELEAKLVSKIPCKSEMAKSETWQDLLLSDDVID